MELTVSSARVSHIRNSPYPGLRESTQRSGNHHPAEHRSGSLQCLLAGAFWWLLWLVIEWVGSFTLRRPVHEILEAWHIERRYMWPYVRLAFLRVRVPRMECDDRVRP